MLIAIAAAALVTSSEPLPKVTGVALDRIVAEPCAAGVITAGSPAVRYDRNAPDPGSVDREPYREAPLLFSAVERREGRCSMPVLRARVTDADSGGGVELKLAPLDH